MAQRDEEVEKVFIHQQIFGVEDESITRQKKVNITL